MKLGERIFDMADSTHWVQVDNPSLHQLQTIEHNQKLSIEIVRMVNVAQESHNPPTLSTAVFSKPSMPLHA